MLMRCMASATLALLLCGGVAVAQDDADDTLDLTMVLLPEGARLPDAVTRTIELPESVAEQARERAAGGLETANEARERREAGLQRAAEAREQGREFGQELAQQAQENRENVARGLENRPELPDRVPDPPGPPPRN